MDTPLPRAHRARQASRGLLAGAGHFAVLIIAPVVASSSFAIPLYWDGNSTGASGNPPSTGVGGTGTWSSAGGQWWNGTGYQLWNATGGQDIADFRGSVGTVTVSGTVNVNRINVLTNNYVFTGGTIAFGAAGVWDANGTQQNNVAVGSALSGSLTINATGSTLNLGTAPSVVLTGNNTGLTNLDVALAANSNTITVQGANSLGGASTATKLTKGIVNLGSQSTDVGSTLALGTLDLAGGTIRGRFGSYTIDAATSLSADSQIMTRAGTTGTIPAVIFSSSSSINLNDKTLNLMPSSSSNGIALNGAISGSGNLTMVENTLGGGDNGNGVLTLGGDNTFSGAVSMRQNGGTVALANVNALKNATLNTAAAGTQAVTFTVAGANTYNIGALQGSDALDIGGNTLSVGAKAATTSYDGAISGTGGGLTKVGSGNTLTLTAGNTYTGATEITGGKLRLTGASGAINSSSGITVNGSGATFVQAAGTAVSPTVTLTQGTVTGSGTINTVNVGAGTGGILSNNDGAAGAALTINALTLAGGANINLFSNGASTAAPLVVGTLTNNSSASAVTITANNPAGWFSGNTYNLISFTSLGGSGGNNFAQVVNNLTTRQSGVWGSTPSAITLTINGNNPYWIGGTNGNWNTTQTGNWKLSTGNADTEFIASDEVIFNDNATGTTTLDINAANVATTSVTFNNSALDYTIGSTGGFGISSGSVTKNGTGSVTLNTSNSYAGSTTVNAGNLTLGNANTSSGTTIVNGGSLTLGHANALAGSTLDTSGSGSVVFSAPGSVTYALAGLQGSNSLSIGTNSLSVGSNGTSTTFSGNLGMQGSLTKVGAGTLTLSGASSHTGATTVNGGTLRIGAAAGLLHSTSTVTLANTSGVTLDLNGNSQTIGALSGGGTTGGTVALGSGNLTIGASTNQTYNGKFTGSGDIIVNAASPSGIVSFAGEGTAKSTEFTGNVRVQSGMLSLGKTSDILGTNSSGLGTQSIIVSSGATARLAYGNAAYVQNQNFVLNGTGTDGNGALQTLGMNFGNAGIGGIVAATDSLVRVTRDNSDAGTRTLQVNNSLAGSGNLTFNGGAGSKPGFIQLNRSSGSLTLGGTTYGAFSGDLGLAGNATLIAAASNSLGNVKAVTVASGSTLTFNSTASQTIGSLAGAGNVNINGSTLTVGAGNLSASFSGALQNTSSSGSFVKTGTGTQTLSGVSSYSGSTTINQGILEISGSGSINSTSGITVSGGEFRNNSSVAVAAGLLNFVSGTVSGSNLSGVNFSVGTNQTVSPGSSPGTLSAGDLTFADGGTYVWEISNATAGGEGVKWDLITANLLNVTAGASGFQVNIVSLVDPTNVPGLVSSFDPNTNQSFRFIDTSNPITSFNPTAFAVNTSGFANAFPGTWSVRRGDDGLIGASDSDLYLFYAAVPEPATYAALAGLGALGLAFLRRRRSS